MKVGEGETAAKRSKPWHTSTWRDKRKELIKGKNCEWCGSSEALSLHHKRKSTPHDFHYKAVSGMILKKLIGEGVYEPLSQEACPKCHSFSIYTEKQ